MGLEREAVLLQEIEDGDLALVLDLGVVAADRGLVERHRDEPRCFGPGFKRVFFVLDGHDLVSAIEPDGDGAAMGVQPLRLGQNHGRRPERGESVGVELEDRAALHEIEHAKA